MNETRQFFGMMLAFAGVALLAAPVYLLEMFSPGTGAGREEVMPLVQSLGAIAGGVLCLIGAWLVLRRF